MRLATATVASRRAPPDGRERWLDWAVRPDATASLAYFVFSEHARRGHGVEGAGAVVDHPFESVCVRADRTNIDTRNLASIRLVERLGFVRESLVLQADHFKGFASDELVVVRLEETIDPSSLP